MSIDSSVAFTNTDGTAFPNNTSINATGPSTEDGTEFVKIMIDNYMFGPMQALLDHAGLTPDGVTEAAGTAQIIEALQKGFGAPPGVVTEWNLASDPGTTGHRCLLLQGQGILRVNYAALDAAVYVGDGNNAAVAAGGGAYYRADDAAGTVPNIVGVYLIMPESRGVTVRGLDTAASIDPDGASRFLGDLQIDSFQGHIHYNGVANTDTGDPFVYGVTTDDMPGLATRQMTDNIDSIDEQGLSSTPKTDGVNGTPRVDSETRMWNRSSKDVIWY